MTRDFGIPQALLVYGLCIPLAIVLGYYLATPEQLTSYGLVALVLGVLAFPLLVRWHHFLLIVAWNTAMVVPFLPGQPSLGISMASASLFLSILSRTMRAESEAVGVRALTWPLIMLSTVVLATAAVTGGIGGRVFGAETWGAKRYLGVLGGVVGYFALTMRPIPLHRAKLYASLFFLSGISTMAGDLIYAAGPKFYFLFSFFAWEFAALQLVTQSSLLRINGLTFTSLAICYVILLHLGIRGVLDLRRPWRLVMFLMVCAASLFGGYRSALILLILLVICQFCYEGLLRSGFLPVLLLVGTGSFGLLLGFADHLPLSVQRSLSFLPIDIDPTAKADALGTLDWRLLMWRAVLPEVPRYLIIGKGFGFSGTDYYLTQEAMARGLYTAYEDTLISGNYHNGLLTILIPFGIFGMICFLWFCWAALRVLHRNYRYGDPSLKLINTFLIAYFTSRLIFYLVFYGQFDLDFPIFAGTIGLNVALNGGVCSPSTGAEHLHTEEESAWDSALSLDVSRLPGSTDIRALGKPGAD
jgi:hypothetical protein